MSSDRLRGEVAVLAGLDAAMLAAAASAVGAAGAPAILESAVLAADGWTEVDGRWYPPLDGEASSRAIDAVVRPGVPDPPVPRAGQSGGGGHRSAARLELDEARRMRAEVERYQAYWWGPGSWARRHAVRLVAVGEVVRRRGLLAGLLAPTGRDR